MEDNTHVLKEIIKRQQLLSVDPEIIKKEVGASPVLVGGPEEIDIGKADPRDIENVLYLHPVIPRGIEIKANRMVCRGYNVTGQHEEAVTYCQSILKESGGIIFLKKLIENTYAFGNGWAELVGSKNKQDNQILKLSLLHPIYFGYYKVYDSATDSFKMVLDPKTQMPQGCCAYEVKDDKLQPKVDATGKVKILPLSTILHQAFDTWGDEIEGISIVTYLQTTINYLLNIEKAAAQAAYLTGNPRYKFTTEITSKDALSEFAQNVRGINERDSIIMTKGNNVEVLSPGNGIFEGYHDKFMNLLAIRLGIPTPFLMMDGTSTNKSTTDTQERFMRQESVAEEAMVEHVITNQVFESACKVKFGDEFPAENVPEFTFKRYLSDEDAVVDKLNTKTNAISSLVDAAVKLESIGKSEEANLVLNMLPVEGIGERKIVNGNAKKEEDARGENKAEKDVESGAKPDAKPDAEAEGEV